MTRHVVVLSWLRARVMRDGVQMRSNTKLSAVPARARWHTTTRDGDARTRRTRRARDREGDGAK
tara:strand:+ start:2122 stop:2313 length:192 start_codon:yes stop_codon:yes gene_type:complete